MDPAILAQLSADSSSVVRVIATHSLAKLAAAGQPSPEVVAALVAAAGSTDAYQRWKAAYGLAYVPEGREVLVRLLREDRDRRDSLLSDWARTLDRFPAIAKEPR